MTTTAGTDSTPGGTGGGDHSCRWVYVVTMLRVLGDPVCPSVVGVYTTALKASAAARMAFEDAAEHYRDGAFLPLSEAPGLTPSVRRGCDHVGREDHLASSSPTFFTSSSKSLLLSKRVLLEVMEPEDWSRSTVVAINRVPFDLEVKCVVPLISQGWNGVNELDDDDDDEDDEVESSSPKTEAKVKAAPAPAPAAVEDSSTPPPERFDGVSKVHVVISAHGSDGMAGAAPDPILLGVYSTVDGAKAAARDDYGKVRDDAYGGHHQDEDEDEDPRELEVDNFATVTERGMLYQTGEDAEVYGAAMDTFVLDRDYKPHSSEESAKDEGSVMREMDLGLNGDGLWMCPEIEDYEEIYATVPCSVCNEEKKYSDYGAKELERETERVCRDCQTVACSGCNTEKGFNSYLPKDWHHASEGGSNSSLLCKDCIEEKQSRTCSICKQKCKKDMFSDQEYQKTEEREDLMCNDCLPQQTKVCSECDARKSFKDYRQDDWYLTEGGICRDCHQDKLRKVCSICKQNCRRDMFSKKEYKKGENDITCHQCMGAKQKAAQKRPAAPVSNEKEGPNSSGSNKKAKVGPSAVVSRQCSECKVDKPRGDYSQRQWKKVNPQRARKCKPCMELCQQQLRKK